jgi:5-methylcytosine-specific restriction endonuclease McrA
MNMLNPDPPCTDWIQSFTKRCGSSSCVAMAGRCQSCGPRRTRKSTNLQFRSHSGPDSEENLITLCCECHASVHSQMG